MWLSPYSDESGKLDMAAALETTGNPQVDEAVAMANAAIAENGFADDDMAIDEDLFLGDDLLEVEEELETLELVD